MRKLGRAGMLAAKLAILASLVGGCGNQDTRQIRGGMQAATEIGANDQDSLWAGVTLCRKVSGGTGQLSGIGRSFVIGPKEKINAVVTFQNVRPGRTYPVHLVWRRPGGQEFFRKYAEVTLSGSAPAYEASIVWRKADDFSYRKIETQAASERCFVLDSSLSIDPEKNRPEGEYTFQVYLYRELLLEEAFELAS